MLKGRHFLPTTALTNPLTFFWKSPPHFDKILISGRRQKNPSQESSSWLFLRSCWTPHPGRTHKQTSATSTGNLWDSLWVSPGWHWSTCIHRGRQSRACALSPDHTYLCFVGTPPRAMLLAHHSPRQQPGPVQGPRVSHQHVDKSHSFSGRELIYLLRHELCRAVCLKAGEMGPFSFFIVLTLRMQPWAGAWKLPAQGCTEMQKLRAVLERLFLNVDQQKGQAREKQLCLGGQTFCPHLNINHNCHLVSLLAAGMNCSYILKEEVHMRSQTWQSLIRWSCCAKNSLKGWSHLSSQEINTLRAAWGRRTAQQRQLNAEDIQFWRRAVASVSQMLRKAHLACSGAGQWRGKWSGDSITQKRISQISDTVWQYPPQPLKNQTLLPSASHTCPQK